MHLRSLACALAFTLAACSSSSPETGTGGAGGTGGTGGAGGAHPSGTRQSYSFSFTTHPGQETHWCQYTRFPQGDGKDVVVTGYDWTWENMHHWALYRTTDDLPADVSLDQPFDCFQPGAMQYAAPASLVLGGGQVGELAFPETTGFGFKPGEIVIVQAHTLNTGTADVTAKLDLGVYTSDPAKVPNRLALIQFYDPYILVPAHTQATAGMRCKIPQDITVVQSTTHQHIRGTGVDVFLDPPGATRADEPFLSSTDWEHPNALPGPLKLEKGSHVRTRCSYLGDAHDVIQGQDKLDNEMCMFVGYYYPKVEDMAGGGLFENCIQDSIAQGVGDEFGTGTATCGQSLSCIQNCPASDAPRFEDGRIEIGKCWQSCMVAGCPSSSEPLDQLLACIQDKCADPCGNGGDCPSCVVSSCGTEYGTCASHACPAN